MSKLTKLFQDAAHNFESQYIESLPRIVKYKIERIDQSKAGTVEKVKLIDKFHALIKKDKHKIKNDFIEHINSLERYLAYSSTPKAFSQAWNFRKSKISNLSIFEVQSLVSNQAQLIPTIKTENLLNAAQKGMIKSEENKAFLYGVRHSKGNYEDKLDELGNFSYQPPIDVLGMLRYRWLEWLSIKSNLPIFIFITIWFKHEGLKSTNHVTMICPAIITKLNKKFDAPLSLRLITVDDAIESIMRIKAMDVAEDLATIRMALTNEMVIKYNYESIKKNRELRIALINWAQSKGKKCPGQSCNNITFSNISNKSKIHLGHIVPQHWGSIFQFLQEKNHLHHPDNLYLSCDKCNVSLNNSFPDNALRENILSTDFGTIGDFIRSDIKYFKDFS